MQISGHIEGVMGGRLVVGDAPDADDSCIVVLYARHALGVTGGRWVMGGGGLGEIFTLIVLSEEPLTILVSSNCTHDTPWV